MSKLMGSGSLLLWLDVVPELDRETDHWYLDEHLPDRVDVGEYLRARRYRALEGSPAYLSLFEARTPEALASEGYLRLVEKISDQSRRIRAGFSNVVRNTFEVHISVGRGMGSMIASIRLAPIDRECVDIDSIGALAQRIFDCAGIVGVHWLCAAPDVRARMDSVRVTGQTDGRADYVLLVEATRLDDLQAVRNTLSSERALANLGWATEHTGVYAFLYEVSGSGF